MSLNRFKHHIVEGNITRYSHETVCSLDKNKAFKEFENVCALTHEALSTCVIYGAPPEETESCVWRGF